MKLCIRILPACVIVFTAAVGICVSFEKTVYNTIEEIGHIHVCVEITCPEHAEREVAITISTSDNSASEPYC